MKITLNRRTPAIVLLLGPLLFALAEVASTADEKSEPARVTAQIPTSAGSYAVERREGGLVITRGGRPVAEYFFRHPRIPRPFFAHLHAPDGTLLTRRFPPRKGEDLLDHDTIHPGLWLAFGDLNGVDFWRNKGRVAHVRFVEQPRVEGGTLAFAVEEPFGFRDIYYTVGWNADFAARNRLNGHHMNLDAKRGGKLYCRPFVHTFRELVPIGKYGKSNPEYYSLIKGQRHIKDEQPTEKRPLYVNCDTPTPFEQFSRTQPPRLSRSHSSVPAVASS